MINLFFIAGPWEWSLSSLTHNTYLSMATAESLLALFFICSSHSSTTGFHSLSITCFKLCTHACAKRSSFSISKPFWNKTEKYNVCNSGLSEQNYGTKPYLKTCIHRHIIFTFPDYLERNFSVGYDDYTVELYTEDFSRIDDRDSVSGTLFNIFSFNIWRLKVRDRSGYYRLR